MSSWSLTSSSVTPLSWSSMNGSISSSFGNIDLHVPCSNAIYLCRWIRMRWDLSHEQKYYKSFLSLLCLCHLSPWVLFAGNQLVSELVIRTHSMYKDESIKYWTQDELIFSQHPYPQNVPVLLLYIFIWPVTHCCFFLFPSSGILSIHDHRFCLSKLSWTKI